MLNKKYLKAIFIYPLNTPRQLSDNTKKVVWNLPYTAFGENIPKSINNTVFNLRYSGQYYDAESKLHYNINRYYDPLTGKYTQSDPIGLSGGINTYTYVGGNAVGYSDPAGLNALITAGVGAGYGSAFGPVGTVVGGVVAFTAGVLITDAVIDQGLDAYANYKKKVDDNEVGGKTRTKNGKKGGGDGQMPGDPERQNKQAKQAAKAAGLDDTKRRAFHDAIGGKNYGWQELLQIAKDIANGCF